MILKITITNAPKRQNRQHKATPCDLFLFPVREKIWVEKHVQHERIVPLGTGYSTDILSLTGQRFPVGDTFSTHIVSLTGKRERTFFTIMSTFFTPHLTGCQKNKNFVAFAQKNNS